MSLINFDQSLDIVTEAIDNIASETQENVSLVYLNTMVMPADKKMIKAIKKRTGLSEGHIIREIFSQWRQYTLDTASE